MHPKNILRKFNIYPDKKKGQNFLTEQNSAQMIASFSNISSEDIVIEIGAGLGILTCVLAEKAKQVIAIEKDIRLVEILKKDILSRYDNIKIINEDVLKIDLIKEIQEAKTGKVKIFGNLPYNISSQIIIKLIACRRFIKNANIMLQKEMAERITAKANTKQYGRLSVLLQYCANVAKKAYFKSNLFYPPPKVDSLFIEIDFFDEMKYCIKDEKFFFFFVKEAFSSRRKTILNSIYLSKLDMEKADILNLLDEAKIDKSMRPENLEVDDFVRLSNLFLKERLAKKV